MKLYASHCLEGRLPATTLLAGVVMALNDSSSSLLLEQLVCMLHLYARGPCLIQWQLLS